MMVLEKHHQYRMFLTVELNLMCPYIALDGTSMFVDKMGKLGLFPALLLNSQLTLLCALHPFSA